MSCRQALKEGAKTFPLLFGDLRAGSQVTGQFWSHRINFWNGPILSLPHPTPTLTGDKMRSLFSFFLLLFPLFLFLKKIAIRRGGPAVAVLAAKRACKQGAAGPPNPFPSRKA